MSYAWGRKDRRGKGQNGSDEIDAPHQPFDKEAQAAAAAELKQDAADQRGHAVRFWTRLEVHRAGKYICSCDADVLRLPCALEELLQLRGRRGFPAVR